jgi:hypothetical protein
VALRLRDLEGVLESWDGLYPQSTQFCWVFVRKLGALGVFCFEVLPFSFGACFVLEDST